MRLCALVACLAAGPAFAADYGTLYNNGHVSVWPESVSGEYTRTNTTAGVRATRPVNMGAPGGRTAAAVLQLDMSKRGVALVAARGLSTLAWPVAAATAAWGVYDMFRTRPDQDEPGKLAADPGQDQESVSDYRYNVENGAWHPSAAAACSAYATARGQSQSGGPNEWIVNVTVTACPTAAGWGGGTTAVSTYRQTGSYKCVTGWSPDGLTPIYGRCNAAPADLSAQLAREVAVVNRCPAYIDPFNPANTIPAGSALGYDGKCPTGSYSQPVTPEHAADIAANHQLTASLDYKALLDEALGRGPVSVAGMPSTDLTFELPASLPSVAGPTTTTTHPDGSSTDVVTGWDWARDAEKKSQGRWKETTTTTKKDAAGVPIGAPEVVTTTEPSKPDAVDPCTNHPNRAGCVDLGEVEDAELEVDERTVSVAAQGGWGADDAVCPAPPMLPWLGVAYDNSVFCNFLEMARFVIVGFASLAAVSIFVGGLKQ